MDPPQEVDSRVSNGLKSNQLNAGEGKELAPCTPSSDEGDPSRLKPELLSNTSSCDSGIESSILSHSPLVDSGGGESAGESKDCPPPNSQLPMNVKKYDDILWKDLTTTVKEAAIRLGYTEEVWNNSKEPGASDKYWAELDSKEKEAAKVLGYDETHWNFGGKDITPEDYDDMNWSQLPRHIRKACRVLGYNKELWKDDGAPASFDKDWDELTEAEQRAARIVGYREETWDEDPEDSKPGSMKEEIIVFIRGASYILLECISLAAFSGFIKMVFSFGQQFLSETALNAFKILVGLVIMQCNGQLHRWLVGEEETQTRGNRKQPTIFRSFLNLFSWWAIFAGVEHFMSAFETDILYSYVDSEWSKYCDDNVTNTLLPDASAADHRTCALSDATTADNMTCSLPNMTAAYNRTCSISEPVKCALIAGEYLLESACVLLDDDWDLLGPIYYFTLFFISAFSMWYVFKDNFLQGCDTD